MRYTMQCHDDECGHVFDVHQKMDQPHRAPCEACGGEASLKLAGAGPLVNTVDTLGQQAERNARRDGKELTALKHGTIGPEAEARTKTRPFWRDTDQPLNLRQVKDAAKYIETGKKR